MILRANSCEPIAAEENPTEHRLLSSFKSGHYPALEGLDNLIEFG